MMAQVNGVLQFWQRSCRADGSCNLPVAIGTGVSVAGELSRSAQTNGVGFYEVTRRATAAPMLTIHLQAIWRHDQASGLSYIALQSRLTGELGDSMVPLAECSQFVEPRDQVFPVGFCAAYYEQDGELMQYGVTFSAQRSPSDSKGSAVVNNIYKPL